MKNKILLTLAFIFQLGLFAQCSINVSRNACVDDAVNLSLTASKAVSSYKWKFGDGHSSTEISPTHIYFRKGTFKVQCEVIFTDGTSCSSSSNISVWESPSSDFFYIAGDSCQYHTVFIIDNSTAVPGQQIVKHTTYWSDGTYDYQTRDRLGDRIEHQYQVSGTFHLRVEVIDQYGCKAEKIKTIEIKDAFKSQIKRETTEKCKSINNCFTNETQYTGNPQFTWVFNGVASGNTSKSVCFNDSRDNQHYAELIVAHRNGCIDTARDTALVIIDTTTPEIILSLDSYCYNAPGQFLPLASITEGRSGVGTSYLWLEEGNEEKTSPQIGLGFNWIPNAMPERKMPGTYKVSCIVNRQGCIYNLSKTFVATGPVARMGIYDKRVCAPADVFLIDSSEHINPATYERYWTINDPNGNNCVVWSAKNQNKGSNCNYGRDFWMKHRFTSKGFYGVKLVAVDKQTGCRDSLTEIINTAACKKLELNPDCFKICEREFFLNLSEYSDIPISFSVDRDKWYKFPQDLPKEITSNQYPLWFVLAPNGIYKIEPDGNDSFKVIRNKDIGIDTLETLGGLCVMPRPDFDIRLTQRCDTWEYRVYPSDSFIRADSRITISWDGSGTRMENIFFPKDTIVRYISHFYSSKPSGKITVDYEGITGCKSRAEEEIKEAINLRIQTDGVVCHGQYLFAKVVGTDSASRAHVQYTQPKYNWLLDTTLIYKDSQTFRAKLKDPGYYALTAEYLNFRGCKDTLSTQVISQDLLAETSAKNKYVNCSRFTQFLDSSILKYPGRGDRVSEFYWDMGDGKGRSISKDPYHVYDKPGVYTITHIAKSSSGCIDTFQYIMKISNLDLSVSAKDTIACTPVTPTFYNNSKNGIGYLWYYGDTSYNTEKVNALDTTTQIYAPAGTYYARLYGYDSFYNFQNKEIYYCTGKSRKVKIVAKPFMPTKILGPDTVCLGEKVEFFSGSSTAYDMDHWYVNEELKKSGQVLGSYTHTWNTIGTYKIKLQPSSINPSVCKMADSLTVVVLSVKASFTTNQDGSNNNLYLFNNTSTSKYKALWELYNPQSSIVDTDRNTNYSYDFINKAGEYTICLTAENEAGCKDRVCTKILANGIEDLKIANVFTPGNGDKLNDDFDIIINGEATYDLCIYNRWNELVFRQTEDDDSKNWNGRVMNKGAYVPDGTYYYIFSYSYNSAANNKKLVRGAVRVIYRNNRGVF